MATVFTRIIKRALSAHIVAEDDPVTCALYAKEQGLLEQEGWRCFKKIARQQKKLLRMVNQAKLCSFQTAKWYQYGYEIPKDHADAMRLNEKNKNTKWADSEALEILQLNEYKAFHDKG